MEYTFKQPLQKKTLWEKIKYHYAVFMKKLKRGLITTAGIVTTMMALFGGHIFTAIVVGGLTYIFWRTSNGDKLVGTYKEKEI